MKDMNFLPNTSNNSTECLHLKDLNETNVKDLFKESLDKSKFYDVYVRLSPKKDPLRLMQSPQTNQHQVSKSKVNNTNKPKEQATKIEILDLISQINDNIKRVELKLSKNLKKKDQAQTSSNKPSNEFRQLRKRTIDLINDGDELLKKVFKIKDLHRNCSRESLSIGSSSKYCCTCNVDTNVLPDQRRVLVMMRSKLFESLDAISNSLTDSIPQEKSKTLKKNEISKKSRKNPALNNEESSNKYFVPKGDLSESKKKVSFNELSQNNLTSPLIENTLEKRIMDKYSDPRDDELMKKYKDVLKRRESLLSAGKDANSDEVIKKLDMILKYINTSMDKPNNKVPGKDPNFVMNFSAGTPNQSPIRSNPRNTTQKIFTYNGKNWDDFDNQTADTTMNQTLENTGPIRNQKKVLLREENENLSYNNMPIASRSRQDFDPSKSFLNDSLRNPKVAPANKKNTGVLFEDWYNYPIFQSFNHEELNYSPNNYQNEVSFEKNLNQLNSPDNEISSYQQKLKQQGINRKEKTEKMKRRSKEVISHLYDLINRENGIMKRANFNNYDLKEFKELLKEALYCLYHVKMIYLTPECFDDTYFDSIEEVEKDLKACIQICESIGEITQRNKPELLQGIHHILNNGIKKVIKLNPEIEARKIETVKNNEYQPDNTKTKGPQYERLKTKESQPESIKTKGSQYKRIINKESELGNRKIDSIDFNIDIIENKMQSNKNSNQSNSIFDEPHFLKSNQDSEKDSKSPIKQIGAKSLIKYHKDDPKGYENMDNLTNSEPNIVFNDKALSSETPKIQVQDPEFNNDYEDLSLSSKKKDDESMQKNPFDAVDFIDSNLSIPLSGNISKESNQILEDPKKSEAVINQSIDSNSSLLPGTLIARTKLRIPNKKQLGKEVNLSATVIKFIDTRTFAVGFTNGSIGFYNLENYELLAAVFRHKGSITCLEVMQTKTTKQKLQISGSSEEDSNIIVWDMKNNFKPIKKLKGHENMISNIKELGDNATIATSSFDSRVVIWDINNNFQVAQILDDNSGPITCLDYSNKDKFLIAGSLNGFILIYRINFDEELNYAGCELLNKFSTNGHVVEIARCYRRPELMISLESDFILRLYDIKKKEVVAQIAHEGPIVDFLVVESEKDKDPLIFAMDNRNNLMKFDLENSLRIRNKVEKSKIGMSRFLGYAPKSQVFIRDNKVFLLSLGQQSCDVSLFKLMTSS